LRRTETSPLVQIFERRKKSERTNERTAKGIDSERRKWMDWIWKSRE